MSCGNQDHADLNAAKNILQAGASLKAGLDLNLVGPLEQGRRLLAIQSTAQGGAFPLGTPEICEIDNTMFRHCAT